MRRHPRKGLITPTFHGSSGKITVRFRRQRSLYRIRIPFRYSGKHSILYAPFGTSLETGCFSRPSNGPSIGSPTALLRAPPRGMLGYSLLSGGRLFPGDRCFALVCIPPAQHRIFRLPTFRPTLARGPQGTGVGYPRRFSPMRTFRLFRQPKVDASQSGFHPVYALSCRMAWRDSFSPVQFSSFADGLILPPRSGRFCIPFPGPPVESACAASIGTIPFYHPDPDAFAIRFRGLRWNRLAPHPSERSHSTTPIRSLLHSVSGASGGIGCAASIGTIPFYHPDPIAFAIRFRGLRWNRLAPHPSERSHSTTRLRSLLHSVSGASALAIRRRDCYTDFKNNLVLRMCACVLDAHLIK